jgi:hypothetical protein
LLEELGCSIVPKTKGAADVDKKVKAALTAALAFAQAIAGQRAVYRVFTPTVNKGDKKKKSDATFTNVDEGFKGCEEERSGVIWYVGAPGLQRCGSPMGEDLQTERVTLIQPFVMLKL